MEKQLFRLIINPSRFPLYVKQLKKLLSYVGEGSIYESRSEEHFQELVEDFLQGKESYLLVWGGDGTANLALNTLMHSQQKERRSQIAIGFLRGGSGNGTQDSYEVPRGLTAQVKTYLSSMANSYVQPVDMIAVNFDQKKVYGQLFGTGVDSRILQERNEITRLTGDKSPRAGFLPYLKPAIKVIIEEMTLQGPLQEITLQEGRFAFRGLRSNAEFPFEKYKINTRAPLIEAGVRPYYGWGYRICPDVVCNDGYFDAYCFNLPSYWRLLLNLNNFWNGNYHRVNHWSAKRGLPLIEHYKTKRMVLAPLEGRSFHIDGELHQSEGAIELEVEPQALRFLVPHSYHHKFHPLHED